MTAVPSDRLVSGPSRPVHQSAFAVVTNGYADGPAHALRDHLLAERAQYVVMVTHPLSAEEGNRHRIEEWANGEPLRKRTFSRLVRPPVSYATDLASPLVLPGVDCWFGFNPLTVVHGLLARRIGRTGLVVYWGVDFVESRFGRTPITALYQLSEGLACRRSDARFELSAAMRDARTRRHGTDVDRLAPARIVPMGAWREHVPECDPDAYLKRKVVYVGHLIAKQGLLELINAIGILRERNIPVELDLIGRGPQEAELKERVAALGLEALARFHGFVEDHRQLEAIVAAASIGAAPYATGAGSSYTVFADPGKLKIYLAAGLPSVTTDAAPVAAELAARDAAVIVDFSAHAIASAIQRLLNTPYEWKRMRANALAMARDYDWRVILSNALRSIGFD